MLIKLTDICTDEIIMYGKRVIYYGDFNVLNLIYRDKMILKDCEMVYPDSSAVYLTLKYYYRKKIIKNISTDIQLRILDCADRLRLSVYFFGDSSFILERTIETVRNLYVNINISGSYNGYNYNDEDVIRSVNESGADILFVGLGLGRQEHWIHKNYKKLNVNYIMSVGGWFQYLSGEKRRAPHYLRTLNLEWLFKLITEYRRVWKRYIYYLPVFLYRVLTKKIILDFTDEGNKL